MMKYYKRGNNTFQGNNQNYKRGTNYKYNNKLQNSMYEIERKNYYNNNVSGGVNFYNNSQGNAMPYEEYEYEFEYNNFKQQKYNNNNKTYRNGQQENQNEQFKNNVQRKDELLKIEINLENNISKELVIFKNSDIEQAVENFCRENSIDNYLIEPLYVKIKETITEIQNIKNNLSLKQEDIMILEKMKDVFLDNTVNNNNNKQKKYETQNERH